jgi:predicted ATPase
LATVYLALTNWLLGEAGLSGKSIEEAIALAVESAHAPTQAQAYWWKALFALFRDDAQAALRAADSVLEVSRSHGLGLFLALGALASSWARARLGDRVAAMTDFRQALAAYADQGNKLFAPFLQGRLAEFEGEGQGAIGALVRIDEALALAVQTGERWTDALLHRIRGKILLMLDPANAAHAEEAFCAAIAVAQAQQARSFELQAALALAKLYQSTNRPGEARAILTPALEGFAPTLEMPEIAEAQALMERLA